MVLQFAHNILWILSGKPLPIWFSTHPFFCPIHQKGRSENMRTSEIEAPRTAGPLAPLSHASARATTVILIAFAAVYVVWGSTYLAIRIGIESFPPLILAGLRHFIVTFPLSRPPVENRHPTDRSQLAHRHGHRFSIALRWQRGRQLGRADRAIGRHSALGGHRIALARDRGLAPPGGS